MSVAGEASGHFTSPEFILVMPVSSKGTETETSTETSTRSFIRLPVPPYDPTNMDFCFPLKELAKAAIEAWVEENGGITPELKESFRKFLALGYGFSHSGKSTLFQYGLDWVLMGIAEAIGETIAFFPQQGVVMDQERSVVQTERGETRAVYPGVFTIPMNTLFTDVGRHPETGAPPPKIDTACGHAAVNNALATIPGLLILVKGTMWDGEGDFDEMFKELRPNRNGNMDDSKFLPSQDGKPSFMQQMYGGSYKSTMCPFPEGCSKGEVEIPKSVVPYAPNFMSAPQYRRKICDAYTTSGYRSDVVKAIIEKAFTKILEEESTPGKLEEIEMWMIDQETHMQKAADKSKAFLLFLAAFGQPLPEPSDLRGLLDRMHRFTKERSSPFTSTKELVVGMKEFLGGWPGDINIPFKWFEERTVALTETRGDPN